MCLEMCGESNVTVLPRETITEFKMKLTIKWGNGRLFFYKFNEKYVGLAFFLSVYSES